LFKRILKILGIILLSLILIISSISWFIRIPLIQTKVVHYVSEKMSHQFKTEIKIKKVNIAFFNKINIEGLLLRDLQHDTLLYSKSIKIRLDQFNFWSEHQFLNLKNAEISNNTIFIKRDEFGKYNFDFLLPKKVDNISNKSFTIDLEALNFSNAKVKYRDKLAGLYANNYLKNINIQDFYFNDKQKQLNLNNLILEGNFAIKIIEKQNLQQLQKNENKTQLKNDTAAWKIEICNANIENANIYFNNTLKPKRDLNFDENHCAFTELNLNIENFSFDEKRDKSIDLKLNIFSTKINRQFEIKKVESFIHYSHFIKDFYLKNLIIETAKNNLIASIEGNFKGDKSFVKNLLFNAEILSANADISEFAYFIPKIASNNYLRKLSNKKIKLNGFLSNSINDLVIEKLKINIDDDTELFLNGTLGNLLKPNEMDIDLSQLFIKSNIKTIQSFLPDNIQIPNKIEKIGEIILNSSLSGKPYKFRTAFDVQTNVGHVFSNSEFDFGQDFKQKKYKGDFNFENFDLSIFDSNEKLGKLSGNAILSGQGFKMDDLSITMNGSIKSIHYDKYDYENIIINGNFNNKLFDGTIVSNDQNAKINLAGTIDFKGKNPILKARTNVQKLDLLALKLSKKHLIFSGEVDGNFEGKNVEDVIGKILIKNVQIQDSSKNYTLQYLNILADKDSTRRSLKIESNVLQASFIGYYDFNKLLPAMKGFLGYYFPKIYREEANTNYPKQIIEFKIKISEPNEILSFFIPKLSVDEGAIEGSIDTEQKKFSIKGRVPNATYNKVKINNSVFLATSQNKGFNFGFKDDFIAIKDSMKIRNSRITGVFLNDSLLFNIKLSEVDTTYNVNLKGVFTSDSATVGKIVLLPSTIIINKQKWNIQNDNFLRFSREKFTAKNIEIVHQNQKIALLNTNIQGKESQAQIALQDIVVKDFYGLVKDKRFNINGNLNGNVTVTNFLSATPSITSNLIVNDVIINEDKYGVLTLNATTDNYKEKINLNADINYIDKQYHIDGFIYPNSKTQNLDLNIRVDKASLRFLEYLLAPNISHLKGDLTGRVKLFGTFKQIKMKGAAFAKNAEVIVEYLKTKYKIEEAIVNIEPQSFSIKKTAIRDIYNNIAWVEAEIGHKSFKEWKINCEINANNFQALNTSKRDNPLYYGNALVNGRIQFNGYFNDLNMNIYAKSNKGTVITIPFNTTRDAANADYIKFIQKNERKSDTITKKILYSSRVSGMRMNMDMDITPDAEIRLIIDPVMGDSLTCKGSGLIQLKYDAKANFEMFGNYHIESGNYGFSYNNGLLPAKFRKDFTLKNGGTIAWNGSPYDGLINAEAVYSTKAVPYDFIADFVSNDPNAFIDAKQRTNVDLLLQMRNNLINPDITFDFLINSTNPIIKNYVNTKLRLLQDDQNEINRQVFGLIMMGRFLPSNNDGANPNAAEAGINTLSEILSSQLSGYLNSLLNEFITDGELAVNYSNYNNDFSGIVNPTPGNSEVSNRNSVEIDFKKKFFNDRVVINIGGNFDFGATTAGQQSSNQIAGDFIIEYKVAEDGHIRIKAYRIGEPSNYEFRNRNKTGIAFSYQEEFNNLEDLINTLSIRKKRKKNKTTKEDKNLLPLKKEEEVQLIQ
jgi:hypothetical protein